MRLVVLGVLALAGAASADPITSTTVTVVLPATESFEVRLPTDLGVGLPLLGQTVPVDLVVDLPAGFTPPYSSFRVVLGFYTDPTGFPDLYDPPSTWGPLAPDQWNGSGIGRDGSLAYGAIVDTTQSPVTAHRDLILPPFNDGHAIERAVVVVNASRVAEPPTGWLVLAAVLLGWGWFRWLKWRTP